MDAATPMPNHHAPVTVYVAETSPDMAAARNAIVHELLAYGYEVLPQEPLPEKSEELQLAVMRLLEKCVLSVHIIGAEYGRTPQDSPASITMLQNTLAARYSQQSGLRRLLWLLPNLESLEERQQIFIDTVRNDSQVQLGAELYETHLEDLKFGIHDSLIALHKTRATPNSPTETAAQHKLYLIFDRRDHPATRPLEGLLADANYNILLPSFDGDPAQVRQVHIENLRTCDAALVYFGTPNLRWAEAKLRELLKVKGYGRATPIAIQSLLLAPPATADKQQYKPSHPNLYLLNALNQPLPQALAPLLQRART